MAKVAENSSRPAIRHVEVHPAEQNGRRGVVLQDPLGITVDQVFVPEGLLPLVSQFDGQKTVAELEKEHAGTVPEGFVAELAQQFDDYLLLVGPRFDAAMAAVIHAFTSLEARPAKHAGSAGYPLSPGACQKALQRIVEPPRSNLLASPRGLVAPHIDIQRGSAGYRAAYQCLANSAPAELYVLFGTGHQGPSAAVTGLAMDWETPLGRVATDRAFVAGIHQRIGTAQAEDVFLHAAEHSLEFQVLFLRHVLGDRPFEVAAFLTGGLPSGSGNPLEETYCQNLLAAFRDEVEASGKRVCFVAGADLAHLGPFFGDDRPIDLSRLERLEGEERAYLKILEAGDPGGFHRAVEGKGNPDRVCGTAPIFLTAALAGVPGKILHYGQAAAEDGSQVVSYCGLVFADS